MIRINLIGVDREKARKPFTIDPAQRIALACSLILVATAAGVGWWFWQLRAESARVDSEIVAVQQEAAQLETLLAEVQQFETQRAQLQQRVQLIEQLRTGQSVPVQLLDHVSRSLPDMLWLTQLVQENGAVTIEGRSTTLIALSDFVGSLGNGTVLQRPIEIINSEVQPASSGAPGQQSDIEVINFTVRAQLASTGEGAAGAP